MSLAIQRIEEILTSDYSVDNYVALIKEIFANVRIVSPDKYQKEFSNFSTHIEGSIHVGNYEAPDNKTIIVFSVELKKESYVENSRSVQRSYVKKLIENGAADAAIVAFYTKDDPKWRLSFVRLDYEMKIEQGKFKTTENITPAKRYSYLVGRDEPCHTAIDQLYKFITDSQSNPTLDELEESFSVEKVTDEFFNLYKEKYLQLVEWLDNNEDFVIEAAQHNYTSAQFAKKLLGQIVFLYFLQKKGWLGVRAWPRQITEKEYKNAFYGRGAKSRELIPKVYLPHGDGTYVLNGKALEAMNDEDEEIIAACVKGNPWGSGSKNFMRVLFEHSQKKGGNFFDDYLEPLFYEALNVNRGEGGYCPPLHCRIPFLSGGLFEPLDGYDWKHNDFAIPNELFSNRKNANDRTADGILDIFDRYNFTMSEDEPMEREVAIDPEMLGKVFENLLEINDRKSKGAFYTPREIVHYMCQESLITYLTKETELKESDVRDFILYGDIMRAEDTVKEKREGNGGMLISEEIYKMDSSGKVVVNRLNDIDNALASVRVADPAVGSGAFPLGMLNEIVRARETISAYYAITMNPYETRMMYTIDRSPYNLKRGTIKNSLFAADMEPSAVDIAQLRLWLSLVIDDEINPEARSPLDGHRNPIPLPNLDCNILCGDSLVDDFMGIPLINEFSNLSNIEAPQKDMQTEKVEAVLPSFFALQDELFYCDDTKKKPRIKEKIEALRDEIIGLQLQDRINEIKESYESIKSAASKPFVLWQLDFARVFQEKGGFDIVIGNPPYIQLQKSIDDKGTKLGDLYKSKGYNSFVKTGDIYCLFYEKGYNILRKDGSLTFITSNKWMRAGYGKALRNFFSKHTNPKVLIDFAGNKVFDSATVDVNILMIEKSSNEGKTLACTVKDLCVDNLSDYVQQNSEIGSYYNSDSWIIMSTIEQSIRNKIISNGKPLEKWDISINYGIKTGCNDAFIISEQKREELIAEDPKSAEIIRPILRGKDIKRYHYNFANLYVILAKFGSYKYIKDRYPAVYNHLYQYEEKLRNRGQCRYRSNGKPNPDGDYPGQHHWLELDNNPRQEYLDDFSKQKITWGNLCLSAQFALAEEGIFINAPSPLIVPGDKYILAVLNSKAGDWYIRQLGVTRNGGYFEYKPMFVQQLPIPLLSESEKAPFVTLIDNILNAKKNNESTAKYEAEINNLVYALYGFTEEEINYIECV